MELDYLNNNNLILFQAISGSRSFGLATENSDTDIRGVYYLPKEDFFGLNYIPQISNETNDITYYEIGRFVELLQKNNPNILEILVSPEDCIQHKNPLMDLLKPEDFLSKLCKDTFAGYAISQIKKAKGLNKKILNPIDKERKSILDFCYILENNSSIPLKKWLQKSGFSQKKCGLVNIDNIKGIFSLFYDESGYLNYKGIIQNEEANQVSVSSVPKGEQSLAFMFCNLDAYSTYCKDYRDYWKWVSERNEDRYNVNQNHGQNYDSKNMMHTIRLLQSCEQIFKTNSLNIRVENRDELLDIKAGNWSYEKVMNKAEVLIKSIEHHYSKSNLPEVPNLEKTTKILVEIRNSLYCN
ncbi:nucleotidyltransferase domain-containing protein [Chryseobacterium sp. Ch-15]|uniref:Nucleotidyltransferase domain-containing protein n=1 Tax=Chryseobacterium muglaense TaxID=2893752 RepID=A0A9Q3YRE8_9FLAO|nr:nucleotidyltransferase domain-containing protein [Chryseobacterium muglaense]MBD3905192.1 nucleotidyltransferase domain-containing protein [Chryseobacterium muglaense]MCC9034103.1 nucleotidyltransferase domain-containing protein [Chryseobacterium muglaense]MCM2555096.1 nucleotidyltransferase domain-containing protein [Chryseobacterium muglaense]